MMPYLLSQSCPNPHQPGILCIQVLVCTTLIKQPKCATPLLLNHVSVAGYPNKKYPGECMFKTRTSILLAPWKLWLLAAFIIYTTSAGAQTVKSVDPKPLYVKTLTTLTETLYRLQQKIRCKKNTAASRAKKLALALLFGYNIPQTLPADKNNWYKFFPSVNVAVKKTKQLMATVSGYGYADIENWGKGMYKHIPQGAAICNLYVNGYGLLQTSSQTKYIRSEEVHMPAIKDSLYALTSRIEYHDANVYFSNLYETKAIISSTANTITARGELSDEKHQPGGVAYTYQYEFADNYLVKKINIRYQDEQPSVFIIEPFVQHPGTIIKKVNDRTIEFTHNATTVRFQLLSGDVQLRFGENEQQ
jgi:hypothetical protein